MLSTGDVETACSEVGTNMISKFVVPMCLIACAVGQDERVDKSAGAERVEKNQRIVASVSLSSVSSDKKMTLSFEWRGQPESAMLVVDIDSADVFEFRPRKIGIERFELHGFVLVRRIGREGRATVTLDNEAVTAVIGAKPLMVSVYVVGGLNADVVLTSTAKETGPLVREHRILPNECGSDFRIVTRTGKKLSSVFPNLDTMTFQLSSGESIRPSVLMHDVWSLVRSRH